VKGTTETEFCRKNSVSPKSERENQMNQHTLDVLEYDKIREILESYATSGLGKRLAMRIRPLTDLDRIEQLISETTELKYALAPDGWLPMGGLHDLSPFLEKLKQGEQSLPETEIILIKETLRAGRVLKEYLQEQEGSYAHLHQLARDIRCYPEIEAKIDRTFGGSGEMLNSASPELKSIRREIQVLRGRIRNKLQGILRSKSVNPYLQSAVVHERKGRPVIAVQERHASRIPGAKRDKSDSGNTIFIEPEGVREMGDALEAAINAEKTEMVRILREITAMIAEKVEPLGKTVKQLAHIDLTYAKVRFSRDYEMNPPTLNTDGTINLKNARHPLLLALHRSDNAESATQVVPIDFRLNNDFNTLIITGPNTGGKTLALKTVGLLTLMAQSGMPVPAGADSTLAIFSHVAADIGDEQSIEQSLSTFSSHLRNIAEILSLADDRSLVLLDELGGGTDPAEGGALGRSILEYLHSRKARTAVTTHITQLKELGYTVPGIENASVEFDIETLQPTYKLLIGTPGSSNALAIAKRLGLPNEVIEDAEKGATQQDDRSAELINQLQAAKGNAEENRRAVAQAEEAARRLEVEYRNKLEILAAQEATMEEQIDREATTTLRTVRDRLDRLDNNQASRNSLLKSLHEIRAYIADTLNESPAEQQRQASIEELETGDKVYVRSLDQVGTLSQLDSQTRKAVVQLGVMQMTVSLDDVEVA
jgi:DNA mismatch repair protein MutS2